jgi:hypothetical protein
MKAADVTRAASLLATRASLEVWKGLIYGPNGPVNVVFDGVTLHTDGFAKSIDEVVTMPKGMALAMIQGAILGIEDDLKSLGVEF